MGLGTYCPPKPHLVVPCVSFRLANQPTALSGTGGDFDGILGTLIGPDDRTLTVVWTGSTADRAVVHEGVDNVKVGIRRPSAPASVPATVGAVAHLVSPLGNRVVRLSKPETQCD